MVLAVASVGVLADTDVTVDDEVVPLHPHRGRVLPSEEVVELRATLVPLLVRRLHVHGVVGEAGEGSLGVSRIPAVGDVLHQPNEGVVVQGSALPGSQRVERRGLERRLRPQDERRDLLGAPRSQDHALGTVTRRDEQPLAHPAEQRTLVG